MVLTLMMLFSTWAESVRQKELEEVMEYMPALLTEKNC